MRSMAYFIAILEDDSDRQAAMADCLEDRFPQYPIRFFATAAEMIWHLRRNLSDVIVIGLDHDLELVPIVGKSLLDPGSGRIVADYLASVAPVCPVVIHTTNAPAGDGMEAILQDAGWATSRVTPYGDLQWIPEVWLRAMRDAVVRHTPVPLPQIAPRANTA